MSDNRTKRDRTAQRAAKYAAQGRTTLRIALKAAQASKPSAR